jgi:hypothetical protein
VVNQNPQTPAEKSSPHTTSETTNDPISSEALESVRVVMAAFVKTIKSYSLYPATHTLSENLLAGLENSLANFL